MFESSGTEIAILSLLVLMVIVLLATFQGRKKKKLPPPKPKASRPGRGDLLPGLSTYDRDLLGRLAWLLRSPGTIQKVIGDEDTFLRIARRALAEGLVGINELKALARKLGYDPEKVGLGGLSTLKLGQGIEVSIADGAMQSGAGEIYLNHPSHLKVRLRSSGTLFQPGKRVDVICKGRDGLYRFETTVQAQEGRKLLLDHTSQLERVQRRTHRRRALRMPVEIKVGSMSAPTRTVDISIGGAAIRNPKKQFRPGQALRCVFDTGGGGPIVIPATIVRTSRSNSIAHIRFNQVEDATTHRLFRSIMSVAGAK
ncbi:MAG: PilZ domain-containing protein [Alkalispirochaetaceae bacterium]